MSDHRRLPRRDLLLLPLVSLATVAVLFFAAEIAARIVYPEQEADSCIVADGRLGLRYRPECHSRVRSFESEWVENRYNACGYRTDTPCGPTPAGSLRVAVIGSSMALGFLVAQNASFAAVASSDLTIMCGQPVEFQNLAGYFIFWSRQIARIPDALRLKPDAVLLEVAPFDLSMADPGVGSSSIPATDAAEPKSSRNLLAVVKTFVDKSRALKVAQHALFREDSLYVSFYLKNSAKSAYMREPLDEFWRMQLARYDELLRQMADRFRENGVPLILMFVPHRAQSRIATMETPPSGVDPFVLDKILQDMAARHHVGFIDVTPDFVSSERKSPGEALFFPIDGHLTNFGHAVAGNAIANALADIVPAFSGCKTQKGKQSLFEKGNPKTFTSKDYRRPDGYATAE